MAGVKSIGLADFLTQIRSEIELSQQNLKAQGKIAMLNLDSAEVEVSFGVKKEVTGSGGVEFYIFAIEAGGGHKSEEIHRLKLKLKPAGSTPVAVAEVEDEGQTG